MHDCTDVDCNVLTLILIGHWILCVIFNHSCSYVGINVCFWEIAHLPLPKPTILPKARSKC